MNRNKRVLSLALALCLALSALPAPALAAGVEPQAPGETLQPAEGSELEETVPAECTCGAQPGEDGITIHQPDCPLYEEPETSVPEEEPTCTCGAQPGEDGVTIHQPDCPLYEEPETSAPEEPTCTCGAQPGEDGITIHQPDCPLYEEPEPLVAPAITAAPLDEETGDMVLTVEGSWDSYAWESCIYGVWSDWPGDGPTITLSKADFVAYGFRCTVTAGEQSITSEVYAYDEAVLERPPMSLMSNGSLEASNDYMWYGISNFPRRFDIRGKDGNSVIRTTFSDNGYRTAISVNGGSKVTVNYQNGGTSVGNSLTAETDLDFAPGGHYVQITYTVTNNGSTTQSFQIGSSADVMIGANDRAGVSFTSNGLKMEGSYLGLGLFNNYDFYLVAPTCDTLWYGYYADAYQNMFNDRTNTATYRNDSGMAWSWNGTVAPGETWTRYVLIGAGKVPAGPKAPTLSAEKHPVLIPGEPTEITGTAEAGAMVHVAVGGEEVTTTADDSGNFSVAVTLPEDYTAEDATLQVWAVGTNGGVSDVTTGTFAVTPLPRIELTTSSVTVMEDTVLADAWYEGFIADSNGQVTHTTVETGTTGQKTVTYTATVSGLPDELSKTTATLTVTVQPQPAQMSQTTVGERTAENDPFSLTATMVYTGGKTWDETGFVYGAIQNPTLSMNDGQVETASAVNTKGGTLTATVAADALTYGITYYVRAYAKSGSTVIYGGQDSFGLGVPKYGTFSVTNNNNNTFTITRTGGTDGEQTVYYRTVNGSAIGGTHFEHKADSVTFAKGETSKTVTVTELGATAQYRSYVATQYSNADRVYFLEIYRVTGGATIGTGKAQRTLEMDSNYHVRKDVVYAESQRTVGTGDNVWPDDNNYVADQSDSNDHDIFFQNNRGNNLSKNQVNFNVQRSVDVGTELERQYLKASASGFLYRATFTYKEDNDGYQHVWISNHVPNSYGPSEQNKAIPLNDSIFGTAFYTARWETSGSSGSGGLSLPSGVYTESTHSVSANKADGKIVDNNYLLFDINDTAQVWFSAVGQNTDKWHMTSYQDWLKVQDDQEPQLLGIAPMAGGVYEVGDEVTIALIFDEIVDAANSANLTTATAIQTNWGTLNYVGGADTNVLYFTGTVSEGASGSAITVDDTSVNALLGIVKDMCTGGTASTGGSASTGAGLAGEGDRPTVTIGEIGNSNGILSATATVTNAAKLEYVWTDSENTPTTGWRIADSGDSATGEHTFITQQSSGTWYLHVRATNSAGITATTYKSYTFGEDSPTLPSISAAVDSGDWAKTHTITITAVPSNAQVSVTKPDGTSGTVSGTTYTATAEGMYTFTMTVGEETYTAYATVTNIDDTGPTVEIHDLTNTTHTEPVTLTVTVSDSQSGIQSVTGTWSNGSDSQPATLTDNDDGTYTTTSPEAGGTWTLTVTATDKVGNTSEEKSTKEYTVNLSEPTIQISGPEKTNAGYVYTYTITAGDSDIISIQLPDGTILQSGDEGFDTSGTFTLTEPGSYDLIVTDEAGHVVTKTVTISEEEGLDAVAPEVRLSPDAVLPIWVNGQVIVTVSVYETGSVPTMFTYQLGEGEAQTGTLAADGDEDDLYEGTFTVTDNGTYTVTVTDGSKNVGTATIEIDNIDTTGPTITVTSDDLTDWTSENITVTFTVADGQSGVDADSVQVTDEANDPVEKTSNNDGSYSFTVSANGTYTITAKDNAGEVSQDEAGDPVFTADGNSSTQKVEITKIDKSQPSLTLSTTAGENGGIDVTASATSTGDSAVTITVSRDGGTAETVSGGSYTITEPGTYTFTATTGAGLAATETVTVYQVTFASAYGTEPSAVLVCSGGKVPAPTDPTQDGYAFAGWFLENADTAFDFSAQITDNITLTARWTLNAPTVEITGETSGTYNGGQTVVTLTAVPGHSASNLSYTYQWYKGGALLDGETGQTLELSTVADSGDYHVVVTAHDDTLDSASTTSTAVTVTISKATPNAPAENTGYTINFDEETITIAEGYEVYTAQTDGKEIQTGGSISGYISQTIYIRTEENDNHEPSGWTAITLTRPDAPAVSAPDRDEVTDTSITIHTVAGYEYVLSTSPTAPAGVSWASENNYHMAEEDGTHTFTGLSANTTYYLHVRVAATDKDFASTPASVTVVTKDTQETPGAITGITQDDTTVTIDSVTGQQYVILPAGETLEESDWADAQTGGDSGKVTFEGLAPGTGYVVYTRKPGSDTLMPSEPSNAGVTTAAQTPGSYTDGITVDYEEETITIKDGYEVSTDGGQSWTTGPGSITLTPGQSYEVRVEETGGVPASPAVEFTAARRPDAPGDAVAVTGETIQDKGDGTVTIPAGMEYSTDGGKTWTSGPAKLENQEAQAEVIVRVSATDTAPHGEEQTYTVPAGTATLTVSFDANGGSEVAAATGIAYNGKAAQPADPTRAGHTFAGWYDGENEFDFDTLIIENMTLTAHWTLNAPSGVEVSSSAEGEVTYGTAVTLTAVPSHDADGVTYTYQWYRDGSSGADTLVGTDSATLTLTNVAESGDYYVVVTAHDGTLDSVSTNSVAVTVTIRRAEVAIPAADTSTFTYNGQEQTYHIPANSLYTVTGGTQVSAGTHTVTVALADGDNYVWEGGSTEDQTYSFTIAQKPLTATWNGLSQIWGSETVVSAQLSGVVDGDQVMAAISGGGAGVGAYTVTAVLRGDDAGNYRIINHTKTLTIYAAPVSFSVTDNAVQYDGSSHTATVTPSINGFHAYTVTYRNRAGETVASPTNTGTYTVWVEITDSNYRHAGGAAGPQQVGTLTITATPPQTYPVSFDANGGSGAPTLGSQTAGAMLTIPADGPQRNGYAFSGWLYGGLVYQPGDIFTMPSGSVTFIAQWQPVYEINGTVQQVVTGGGDMPKELPGVKVTLRLGSTEIANDTTDQNGAFSFTGVSTGLYNLVAQYEGITVTSSIDLTADSTGNTIIMPEGKTNSIVTVAEDTPVSVVGKLDTVFTQTAGNAVYTTEDQQTVEAGGIVEVELTASIPSADVQKEIQTALETSMSVDQSANLGLFLDLTVEKTVTEVDGTQPENRQEIIGDTGVLLETHLTLPADLQGKDSYVVYRIHNGEVQALTETANDQGEYIIVAPEKTELTICARYYSTYVLAWVQATYVPPAIPTYPPVVEQTEGGRVTVSPSAPTLGGTVTITAIPDEGYEVGNVTVTNQKGDLVAVTDNGDGTYTFTQPSGSVTISVTFWGSGAGEDCPRDETCPMAQFADVDMGAWYHDGVHFCLEQGLMIGTSAVTFDPAGTTTRGMLMTILARLDGRDTSASAPWYQAGMIWAVAEGVSDGTDPTGEIQRQQVATMLYRYAGGPEVSGDYLVGFADADEVADWAKAAMNWAVSAGIITGGDQGLDPEGTATRVEMAAMLQRFCENVLR